MMCTTAKCRGCGAAITWAVTAINKKHTPLDAKPEQRFVIQENQTHGGLPVVTLHRVYTPHFATCPAASSFRRPT